MTDVVLVLDRDGRYLWAAPTFAANLGPKRGWASWITGKTITDVFPDAAEAARLLGVLRRAIDTGERQEVEYHADAEVWGRELWFAAAVSRIDDEHVVWVARDVTGRVEGLKRLEERVAERTRELEALLEVSRALTSTLELRPLLERILDELRHFVDYAGASVSLLRDGMLHQVAVRRPRGPAVTPEDTSAAVPADTFERLGINIQAGEPLLIHDVHDDSAEALVYRDMYDGSIKGKAVEYIRSFMNLPLIARGEVVGVLSIAHDQPGFFRPEHADRLRPLATQAAIAIENAGLFEGRQKRANELAALLEVSRAVASTLEPHSLMGVILDQLGTIIDHTGSSVLILKDGELEFVDQRSVAGYRTHIGARLPADEPPTALWDAIRSGETVIIDDVRSDEPMAADYRSIVTAGGVSELPPLQVLRSWMGVPLMLKDQVIGMLTVSHVVPAYFNPEHARLARAFADQAAIAMENARLFEQAQHGAALEERQRLARELHDSVSQALYGIALGARTARTLLERDPPAVAEPVEYISSLAEAGLTEMRALIFELRPESLEMEGLVAAISKQAAAIQARHGMTIECRLDSEPALALPVKEALYRITQEALHNVVKHAGATSVTVTLDAANGRTSVTIQDNGRGFDPEGDFPGHLGLRSMRERAAKSGGALRIVSGPREGTRVTASFPA
jgi:signal transduction histidine kinase